MAESTSRKTVMVTGAFGNVGTSTGGALLSRGHQVVAFDLPTLPHRAAAVRLRRRGVETVWGDVTDSAAVAAVVHRSDAVVHLATLIPPHSGRRGSPYWRASRGLGHPARADPRRIGP